MGCLSNVRPSLILVVAGAVLLTVSAARADTPEARGKRLLAQKRYAEAIDAFREAAKQPGRVGYDFTCEIGLCYASLDDYPRAQFYLALCREDAIWPRWKKRALPALRAVESRLTGAQLAKVHVDVSPAEAMARFDVLDDVGFNVPRDVWLPVGSHTLSAYADGYQAVEQQVILYGSDPVTVSLELEPLRAENAEDEPASVDFGEEEPFEETEAGDLPKVEHGTLLPKRFRRGGAWRGDGRAPDSRLSPGLKVGLGYARLSGADAPDSGGRLGVAALAFLSYRVAGSLSLQPEIGWVRGGAEGSALDYLELPVLAVYSRQVGPISARFALGPQLGLSLTDRLDGREISRFELSAVASAEARFPCGVILELRYAHGLTTVDGESPSGEVSNRAFSLLGGYAF